MAIYTTLFTATDPEITEFFPEWRHPLPAPRQETRKNPFTTKEVTVTIWDPGPPTSASEIASVYDVRGRSILPPAMPPDGEFKDYQISLERNCPPLLRTLPHIAMKGISHSELQSLGTLLVGDAVPPARFVDCREDEGCIGAIQAHAIPLLANGSEQELRDYSKKWQARLEKHGGEDLHWVLSRVKALAQDAISRQANLFS